MMYAVTTTWYDALHPSMYETQTRKQYDKKAAAEIAALYIERGETFVGIYQCGREVASAYAFTNWTGDITDIRITHDVDTYDNEVVYIVAAMKRARRERLVRRVQG